eukprot:jgi/Psemu1/290472/fgenesh1_pg.504_\
MITSYSKPTVSRLSFFIRTIIPLHYLLSNHLSIFMSTKSTELPIVINTGASLSISPTLTNFFTILKSPRCKGLKQLHGETEVVGEGITAWDIEDVHSVCRRIETTGYYVPQASICLFSPHSYIQRDSTAQFLLNGQGSFLTLKCGTTLEFQINTGSNLPFMLTEKGITGQPFQPD